MEKHNEALRKKLISLYPYISTAWLAVVLPTQSSSINSHENHLRVKQYFFVLVVKFWQSSLIVHNLFVHFLTLRRNSQYPRVVDKGARDTRGLLRSNM